MQRVLRAASAFKKAELLAKRGNQEEAEKQAQAAVEGDPTQAEYVAFYADLLSQRPERGRTGDFADVIRMVNESRKREPDNPRIRLHRARVMKRSGDLDASYREYRFVAEQDARNVEAAREIRLYEMRGGKKGTTDPRRTVPGRDGKPGGPKTNPGVSEEKTLGQDVGQIFGKLFKR